MQADRHIRRVYPQMFSVYICLNILIECNPPRGGFLFTMFPRQEPCVGGTPSKDLYQDLLGGFSYTRFLMREHSKKETLPGGGVSFDQYTRERIHTISCKCIYRYIYICIYRYIYMCICRYVYMYIERRYTR